MTTGQRACGLLRSCPKPNTPYYYKPGECNSIPLVVIRQIGGYISIEANEAIIRQWFDEFWNARKLEMAAELLMNPDHVFGEDSGAGYRRGYDISVALGRIHSRVARKEVMTIR
jgi:hypothetical protein